MGLKDPQHFRERISLMLGGIRKLFSFRSRKELEKKPETTLKAEDGTKSSVKNTNAKRKRFFPKNMDYRNLLIIFHCLLMGSLVVVSYSLGRNGGDLKENPVNATGIVLKTFLHTATLMWSLFFFSKFQRKTVEVYVRKLFKERKKIRKESRAAVTDNTTKTNTSTTCQETITSTKSTEELPKFTEKVSSEKRIEMQDQLFVDVKQVILPMPPDDE